MPAWMTRPWLLVAVLVLTVCISYLMAAWAPHADSPAMAPAEGRIVTAPPLRDVAALPAVRVADVHRRPGRAPRRAHARRHRVARVAAARAVRAPAVVPVPRRAPVATVPDPRPVPTIAPPAPRPADPDPRGGIRLQRPLRLVGLTACSDDELSDC